MKKPTGKSPSPQSGAVDQAPLGPSGSATLDEPQSIAGVIGVVPGEVSPEEKARARQMLNALKQIRERSPRPSRQGISPPPQEHSAAASGESHPKRKKLDDILAPALAEIGYKKVARLTYRGEWSTSEVEHVLKLETYGTPKIYLTGSAGLQNPQASVFADQCRDRYADRTILQCLREFKYVPPPWFYPTQFPIGLLLHGSLPWWLDISACSPSELARILANPCDPSLYLS